MTINVFNIIFPAVFIALAYVAYKVKNTKFRLLIAALILTFIAFNPVSFEQEGGAKLERRNYNSKIEVPEKVVVEMKSFEESQREELEKLEKESKKLSEELFKNEKN